MKNITKIGSGFIVLLLLFSCSTMSPKQAEEEARQIAEHLNQGQTAALTDASFRPFLFETEILLTEDLISALWQGLADASYTLKNPVVAEVTECGPSTYQQFAETWEVEVYCRKYIPEEAFLVRVRGDGDREIILLLNRDLKEDYRLIATKVVQ